MLAPSTFGSTFLRVNKPGTAAVLSLVVPGVGQIYNGHFLRGIFWLIITPGFWIGTGGVLGWICHLIAAYTAYKKAQAQEGTVAQLPYRAPV
jgi:TM2 domain-containing membrane protein YozV